MPGQVVSLKKLKEFRKKWRKQGKKLVFTNGCFDLLHLGHIRYLKKAKSLGDILVVGLNSDRSVKKIKGEKRPILPEKERAEILSSLWFVDYVVLFNEETPERLIKELEPDVLVKGADWKLKEIVGADLVRSRGGVVRGIPLYKGRSTTSVIDEIIRRYCSDLEK